MRARVMISSVSRDKVPLGQIEKLGGVWHESATLAERLKAARLQVSTSTKVPFSFVRHEIQRHLQQKYGFETYIFEEDGGTGGSPQQETVAEAERAHLVIALYGSSTGWSVPGQDPLTPTLREWRAALQFPLKFRVFWLQGSSPPETISGPLGEVLKDIANYKEGKVYSQFSSFVDLCVRIDRAVQDYIQLAVVRYVADTVAKAPADETEDWLLSPYKERVSKMSLAFGTVATSLGIKEGRLIFDENPQSVTLHCVPDSFSIPESRKFVAYIFDTEGEDRAVGENGKLNIVAAFGNVSDGQVRRHIGNFEAARVYKGPWGLFASESASGTQCVYLPQCSNSLAMQSRLSQALDWLREHSKDITELAKRRQQILDVVGGYVPPVRKPVRATRHPVVNG
jgi:hypothetical protein